MVNRGAGGTELTNNGKARASLNIALLIDADNAAPASLDPVLTVLAELGTVNIRRAYGNWSKASLSGWSDISHQYAIEPHQQFDMTKGKNATDMKMTIDGMDLLFGGRVDGFGIMSSDSDFAPLVLRIRQDGLPVYGFGTDKAPVAFRQACTRFIDVAAINPVAGSGASPPKKPIDDKLIKLLIEAVAASKRDEKGFASLSEVGKLVGNRSPFDTRNYGFARLVDLVEAIPKFAIERRSGTGVHIRRVQ